MRGRACCRCGGQRGAGGAGEGAGGGARRGLLLGGALLLYCGAGAALFRVVEGPGLTAPNAPQASHLASEEASQTAGAALRARCVERLWALTEDLNILYRDNWTALAARELSEFQRLVVTSLRAPPPDPMPWTFAGSFLYALTLVTTIGPGGAPRSAGGKVAVALYAMGGMPLVLLYLAAAGGALASATRRLCVRLRHRPAPSAPPATPSPKRTPFQAALNLRALRPTRHGGAHTARVPLVLPPLLVGSYVVLGGALFRVTERWSLADGCYFSFSSLATIGLGALRPGRGGEAACAAAAAYIVVGVALVAAAFDLLRGELRARVSGGDEASAGGEVVAVSLVS